MQVHEIRKEQRPETLSRLIQSKAENLFITRQLTCSEAVLSVLNNSLDGGLPSETAIWLGSGLSEGIGGSGCTCGALTGGIVALGLFLGHHTNRLLNGNTIRQSSQKMHDQFKREFTSTCCRVLIKDLIRGSSAHFEICAKRTGWVAEKVAGLILEQKPELRSRADLSYLKTHDSVFNARLKKLSDFIRG